MNKNNKISIIIIIGIIMMFYGIIRKEHLVVFAKATKICLECIGIG
ncbi:CD1871A family CXXC motif-containing protein [Fusobacterium sp. PH5-44]